MLCFATGAHFHLTSPPLSPPYHTLYSLGSSSGESRKFPVEVSRALTALRCLPCLVGSIATTQNDRREAVQRPLSLVEDILTSCSMLKGVAATERTPVRGERKNVETEGSASKGSRKQSKRKSKGGDDVNGIEDGVGEQARGECGDANDEVDVLRAYALEAGVGLCCLLPADTNGETGHDETIKRLTGWHER